MKIKDIKIKNKKVKGRSLLRSSKPSITIDDKEIEKVFDDPNRFFKGEIRRELL